MRDTLIFENIRLVLLLQLKNSNGPDNLSPDKRGVG